MSTLIGVLVDVSGSMKQSAKGNLPDEENGSWARSIFEVVDGLIKYDVTSSNKVFTFGFGGNSSPEVFDLFKTLETADGRKKNSSSLRLKDKVERALDIIERHGGPFVREWTNASTIMECATEEQITDILYLLETNDNFRRKFVYNCLPEKCRRSTTDNVVDFLLPGFSRWTNKGTGWAAQSTVGTKDQVEETIKKALVMVGSEILASINIQQAVVSVHKASELLHGCLGEEELTKDQAQKLLQKVEPFIYGCTPFWQALEKAQHVFALNGNIDSHKLLFILSDGEPTDNKNNSVDHLKNLGVTVVTLLITNKDVPNPRKLYTKKCENWTTEAKLMFDISSTLTTQLIPRTIFIKKGWQIEVDNNETKLFFQVNHPKLIEDVCSLARDVVCCQDALADVLGTVSLDLYINQANTGFHPKEQKGGTCYANAIAAVMHMATRRVVHRMGGYPDFFHLREDFISKHGIHGANTFQVLREVCPDYRLQCNQVDFLGALKAISCKRPVVAKFRLTDSEWSIFGEFFKRNPTGILTKEELDIKRRNRGEETSGHAVVLMSYNSKGLRLMNSWGSSWADGGFFKVENSDVLGLEFMDVFWTLNDLNQSEKDAYQNFGAQEAGKLFNTLKGLQEATYICPIDSCSRVSKVSQFSGNAIEARCPQCGGTFRLSDGGESLAMSLYLASLCS